MEEAAMAVQSNSSTTQTRNAGSENLGTEYRIRCGTVIPELSGLYIADGGFTLVSVQATQASVKAALASVRAALRSVPCALTNAEAALTNVRQTMTIVGSPLGDAESAGGSVIQPTKKLLPNRSAFS